MFEMTEVKGMGRAQALNRWVCKHVGPNLESDFATEMAKVRADSPGQAMEMGDPLWYKQAIDQVVSECAYAAYGTLGVAPVMCELSADWELGLKKNASGEDIWHNDKGQEARTVHVLTPRYIVDIDTLRSFGTSFPNPITVGRTMALEVMPWHAQGGIGLDSHNRLWWTGSWLAIKQEDYLVSIYANAIFLNYK